VRVIAVPIRLDTFRAMNDNAMPAPPVDIDPRHAFLTAKEVIPRYGGPHLRLPDAGEHRLPPPHRPRFRLDALTAWNRPCWPVLSEEATQRARGRMDQL
jgi:hypothetical protein